MGLQIPALNEQDSAGQIEVNEAIFGQSFNETLIHQLVVRYMAVSYTHLTLPTIYSV